MTEPLTMARDADALERVTGLPADPPGVFRSLLTDRLERGVAGLLTVVQAPPGAGKTTGVATWASTLGAELKLSAPQPEESVSEPRGLVWLDLDESTSRPDRFVPRLVERLAAAGLAAMPRLGLRDLRSLTRRRAVLAATADALRIDGPWYVILDNFPTGKSRELGADLEFLLTRTERSLRVVVLADAQPALPLHRLTMAGEVTVINGSELDLSQVEVAQLLRQHGVDPIEPVVDAVLEVTHGWPAGVRLAAQLLGRQPRAAALAAAGDAIAEFLRAEVLTGLPDDVRDVVERLSIVGDASDELARELIDTSVSQAVERAVQHTAFVERSPVGQVRIHPVLASAAAESLRDREPATVQALLVRAAHWYAATGEIERAFETAARAGDWAWIGRTLVHRLAVPDILAGKVSPWALHPEVLDREPVLRAAVDVARRDLDRMIVVPPVSSSMPASEKVSWSFVALAAAVATGDTETGSQLVAATQSQVLALPRSVLRDARELITVIDACAGGLAFAAGDLDSAAQLLTRVASGGAPTRCSPVRRQAVGHLALVEAICGSLGRAAGHADDVLTSADRFGGQAGVAEATLARAWIHVERLELDDARRLLDGQQSGPGASPTSTADLRQVLQIRLLSYVGEPEAAVRLASALRGRQREGWSSDLTALALARAWLAEGEPRRALESLTPEPARTTSEARLVAATAREAIGDLRGARALVAASAATLPAAPIPSQIEGWLLEARLVLEDGNEERARLLVDRALRAATAEGLRAPFMATYAWLRTFLGRNPVLQRTHRPFVASLEPSDRQPPPASTVTLSAPAEQVLEALSERESQVLQLLAMMCSTDEIAAELYVSGNTVKTHVKSIFRKLGVNRRVDAVRVGRSHGLC